MKLFTSALLLAAAASASSFWPHLRQANGGEVGGQSGEEIPDNIDAILAEYPALKGANRRVGFDSYVGAGVSVYLGYELWKWMDNKMQDENRTVRTEDEEYWL